MMEEVGDTNWRQEIRRILEEFVKIKSKERLLSRAKLLRKRMKSCKSSAGLIRNDRDGRARTSIK
ncbi:Uncharacterised protein [uncultured archaeon]|nr:Uncharacterised protein [uncultured archaeon]